MIGGRKQQSLLGGVCSMKGSCATFTKRTSEQDSPVSDRRKAKLGVQRKCRTVRLPDLDVDRRQLAHAALAKKHFEQGESDTPSAVLGLNIQVIDVAARSAMLHCVARREHGMTDSVPAGASQPSAAQGRIRHKLAERAG